jgi:hypothetical protein
MLSRNLYEIDEVKSALQICLRRQSWRALFWLWELIISEEIEVAKQVLRDTWLMWGAPHDIALIHDIDNSVLTEENGILCICILRRIMESCRKTDSMSAFRYLNEQENITGRRGWTNQAPTPAAAERRRIRVAKFIKSLDSEEITEKDAALFWIGIDSALRRGLRRDAFWFLQAAQPIMSANAIWSSLKIAARGPGAESIIHGLEKSAPRNPAGQILHQSAAVLFLCTRVSERGMLSTPTFPVNKVLLGDWESWSAQKNRRAARVHAIPKDAIHSGTTRGQTSSRYTNIADIRDPIPLLLESCAWWCRVVSEMGILEEEGEIMFPTDDVLEVFTDTYFPDDIPDEWSAADQQKSHGRGVAETALSEPAVWIRAEQVEERAWKVGYFLSP